MGHSTFVFPAGHHTIRQTWFSLEDLGPADIHLWPLKRNTRKQNSNNLVKAKSKKRTVYNEAIITFSPYHKKISDDDPEMNK
jgi:hypothetical protein